MTDARTAPEMPPALELAMLVYPGMTLLDLVGPQTALGHHGKTHLVWESTDPILTDSGVTIVPTTTFADCPENIDVLFAPGGYGTFDVMENQAALDFMAERAKGAKYVTSVCTGSLILAAAGLLEGRRAATHWSTREILAELGVEVSNERVVKDGNRITGGGVTAGIDFGLTLLAELRGDDLAKVRQLMMEYDPEPPFDAGSPEKAGPELTGTVLAIVGDLNDRGHEIARRLSSRRTPAVGA